MYACDEWQEESPFSRILKRFDFLLTAFELKRTRARQTFHFSLPIKRFTTIPASRLVPVIPSQTNCVGFFVVVAATRRWHRTPIVIKLFPNQWIDNIWYVLQLNVAMLVLTTPCRLWTEEYVMVRRLLPLLFWWWQWQRRLVVCSWSKLIEKQFICTDCVRNRVKKNNTKKHRTKDLGKKWNERRRRWLLHFFVCHWLTSTSNGFDSELSWHETQVPTCMKHTQKRICQARWSIFLTLPPFSLYFSPSLPLSFRFIYFLSFMNQIRGTRTRFCSIKILKIFRLSTIYLKRFKTKNNFIIIQFQFELSWEFLEIGIGAKYVCVSVFGWSKRKA